jgi:hypothetical protein
MVSIWLLSPSQRRNPLTLPIGKQPSPPKLVDKSYPTAAEFNTPGRATQCVIFCPAATPKEAKQLIAKAIGTPVNFNLKYNPVAECFTAQQGKTIRQLLSGTPFTTHMKQ